MTVPLIHNRTKVLLLPQSLERLSDIDTELLRTNFSVKLPAVVTPTFIGLN